LKALDIQFGPDIEPKREQKRSY